MPSLATPEATVPEPESLSIHVVLSSEDDHWSALLPDYTIAGRGDDPTSAAINACEMLFDYLRACEADGISVEDARRPLPLKWRLEVQAKLFISKLMPSRRRRTIEEHRPMGPRPLVC